VDEDPGGFGMTTACPTCPNETEKQYVTPRTKTAPLSVTSMGMLNMGESADGVLPERALALATDRTSDPMTLSERVLALFEQLRVPVFRCLLRKTRDSGQAEDITQETFLRLFRHLREDRLLDNPRAWLFTVANNLAIDANRNESHIKDLELPGQKLKNRGPAPRRTPKSSCCNASVWIGCTPPC
jgi:hypothetical protein